MHLSLLFSADKWWQAAIAATLYVIRERHRKWTKDHLVSRAQLNRQYVALYEAILDNPYLVSQVEKVSTSSIVSPTVPIQASTM